MSRSSSAADVVRTRPWFADGRYLMLATLVLALLVGVMVGRWPTMSVAALVALVLVIGTLRSREFALAAVLASSLLMLSVTSWFGLPDQAALLTKALIGLFALTVLLDIGPENPLRIPLPFLMLLGVLVVFAMFVAADHFLAVQALAAFLAPPLAYVAIVHANLTIGSLRRVALMAGAIIAAQLPIVLVQARYFTPYVDQMGGTFGLVGGTHVQSIVMGFAWTLAVALLLGRRRLWLIPIGLAISIVLLVSEAKAGFLFAAIGTLAVGLARAVANPKRGLGVLAQYLVITVVTVGALFAGYALVGSLWPGGQQMASYWSAWLHNPQAISDYLFAYDPGGQAGRLQGVSLVLGQNQTLADLLIGRGPGFLSSSALLGQSSNASSTALVAALGWATSATRELAEIGLLGIVLYVCAIGYAVWAVVRAWAKPADELSIAVVAAAVGMAVVFITGAFFLTAWTTDAMSVSFWCFMGMAVKWGTLRRVESEARSADAQPAETPALA